MSLCSEVCSDASSCGGSEAVAAALSCYNTGYYPPTNLTKISFVFTNGNSRPIGGDVSYTY